jgi:hypothetical protein
MRGPLSASTVGSLLDLRFLQRRAIILLPFPSSCMPDLQPNNAPRPSDQVPKNPAVDTTDARGKLMDVLTPKTVHARKLKKLKELLTRRVAKEISLYNLDVNLIRQLNQSGTPLTRKDMLHETGHRAIVLTRQDFAALRIVDFIHVSGERMVIDSESLDPNDVFILYPEEVGNDATGA